MAQFTVYKNKNRDTCSAVPFLLDIQNDLFEELETIAALDFLVTGI
jgi:CcdB protein